MGISLCATDIDLVRDALAKVEAARETPRVLSQIASGAASLCRTPLAAITMLTGVGDRLSLLDVFGTGGRIVEGVLPVESSLNGAVVTSGRSFHSPDVWRDSRPIARAIAKRNNTRSVLIAPLAARGRVGGTLAVARRHPGSFSARDQAVLETFASIASLAIENARLREQLAKESGGAPEIRPVPDPLPPRSDRSAANGSRLTPRDREIVDPLPADRTCQEVASALDMSPGEAPVSKHASTIRQVAQLVQLPSPSRSATDRGAPARVIPFPPHTHRLAELRRQDLLEAEWEQLFVLVAEAWSWRDPDSVAAVEASVTRLKNLVLDEWGGPTS